MAAADVLVGRTGLLHGQALLWGRPWDQLRLLAGCSGVGPTLESCLWWVDWAEWVHRGTMGGG